MLPHKLFNMKSLLNQSQAIFNFLSVSLLFAILPCFLSAQTIDWVIEPMITDADEIMLNQNQQEKINLIAFKKEGKWGMKNERNELLAPAEFDGAQVWLTGKYFDMRKGSLQRYFDTDGYEVDYSEVKPYQSKVQSRKKIKELEDDIASLEEKYDWIDFNIEDIRIVALNKISKDTISSIVFKSKIHVTEEGYSIWSDYKTRSLNIKDRTGKIVRTIEGDTKFVELRSDRFLIRKGSKKGLLDAKGNVILKTEYENINFVSDSYIEISREGEIIELADLDGKVIPGMSGVSIYKSKVENKIIIKKANYETTIFDEITKKSVTYPFRLVGNVMSSSIYQVKNSDTLSGLYNIVTDEEIVPCKYRRVKRNGSYFMVGNYKVVKSKRRKQTLQYRSIINNKGDVILQDSMIGFDLIDNKLISVLGSNKIIKIYKTDGTFVEELAEKSSIRSSKNPNYFMITGTKNGYVKVDQYLLGKMETSYESVGKPLSNRSKTKIYSIVKRGGKVGLIDQQGNTIIPLELDGILLNSSSKKYVVVKKDDKWGVIINPFYDE